MLFRPGREAGTSLHFTSCAELLPSAQSSKAVQLPRAFDTSTGPAPALDSSHSLTSAQQASTTMRAAAQAALLLLALLAVLRTGVAARPGAARRRPGPGTMPNVRAVGDPFRAGLRSFAVPAR